MRVALVILLTISLSGCISNVADAQDLLDMDPDSYDRIAKNASWPETEILLDPVLPAELQPLVDAPAPVLAALPWLELAGVADPIGFGQAMVDMDNRSLREFELAARYQQAQGNDRAGPFHSFGHPEFNRNVAYVPVEFVNDQGFALHGEFLLPARGERTPADGPFPLVFALEGLDGNTGMYRWWHQVFADAGYLVFAFDYMGQGHSEGQAAFEKDQRLQEALRDAYTAFEWVKESSEVKDFIDWDQVGVIGHSMGSITALSFQQFTPEVKAVVAGAPIHQALQTFTEATVPIMIQTGDHDGPIAPIPFVNPLLVRSVYDMMEGDRAYIVAEAATHDQHANRPLSLTPSWSHEIAEVYSLAWLDYYVRGIDTTDVLLQPIDHLSPRFDSLVEMGGNVTVLQEGLLEPPQVAGA